jgi:integrase
MPDIDSAEPDDEANSELAEAHLAQHSRRQPSPASLKLGSWDYPAGSSRQRLLSRISTASCPSGRAHRRRSRGPVSRITVITRGSRSAAHVLGQQVSDQRERCLPLILGEIVPGPVTREDIPIRERTLWRMLYETAARSAEVLRLDVPDLDMPNRKARVRRKGGADVIVWQTGTARLLPRLLKGRTSGPVFVTERRARVQLPAADLDPDGRARLSYQQAQALFSAAAGGATLHQLRHSALTHDAEDGTSTPMLMARSGHTSVQSLAGYARVSAEALQRHQAGRDPARRR